MVWSPWQHLTRCWGVLCRTTAMYKKRGGYRLQVLMSEEFDLRYLSIFENKYSRLILSRNPSKLTFIMIWSVLQRQSSICPGCPTTRSSCHTKNGVSIMCHWWRFITQCFQWLAPLKVLHYPLLVEYGD